MSIEILEEKVKGFVHPDYGRVVRDGAAYVATERFVRRGLKLCLMLYSKIERLDQTARLIRDAIDFLLRRYHGYSVQGRIKAHYRDRSIKANDKVDFEHVIPASVLTALLLQGRISVDLAMNPPTCLVKKRDHRTLQKQGYGNRTPDVWSFWRRYDMLGIELETHNGVAVDPKTWNLGTHVTFFKI